MTNDWSLGDIVTADFSGFLADCKIMEVSLHAREGSPIYETRAVFKVLKVEEPGTVVAPAILAGAYLNPNGSVWRWTPTDAWYKQADLAGGYRGIYKMLVTGDDNLVGVTGVDASVWMSSDWGMSWNHVQDIGDSTAVYSLAKLSTDTLLLGTGNDCEVWRSTDGGFTWTFIRRMGSGANFDYVLNLAEAANGDIIASVEDGNVAVDAEIWRSRDDGLTWTQVATLPDTDLCYSMTVLANGYIIMGSWNSGDDGLFWRSTDNGATWTAVQTCVGNDEPECFVVLANSDILAGTWGGAGQAEIWKSTDNGATWAYLSDVGAQAICRTLILDHDDAVIASVSDAAGGTATILRSTDSGATWVQQAQTTGYNRVDCMLKVGQVTT